MKAKNGSTSFLTERQKGGKVRFNERSHIFPTKRKCA